MSPHRLLDDQPIETGLLPGLEELSNKLAEHLPTFPASSPVLISAPWGAGKTSLLMQLAKTLRETETPVCLFEAWRYEGELPLLAALVRTIHETIENDPAWLDSTNATEAKKAAKSLWKAAVSFSLGAAPALATLLGGPLGAVMASLVKGLKEAKKTDGKVPTSDELLDEMTADHDQELWDAFRELMSLIATPEHPFVILIDDLDRCSPEATVRLLDNIRHIVARASSGRATGGAETKQEVPLRFVAALDRGVLADAIRHKFANLSTYDGNRYLEKIFPLVFTLPMPNSREIERFVNTASKALPNLVNEDQANLRKVFANPIFANARLIKRVLNRYALWLRFEGVNAGDAASQLSETEQLERLNLVRWLAVCERWPALRGLLARRDSVYWTDLWDYAQCTEGIDQPPDAEAGKTLEEQDLRTWLALNELKARGAEAAERALRKWGL